MEMELMAKIESVRVEGSGPDPWLAAMVVKRLVPGLRVGVLDLGGEVDPLGEVATPYFTRQLLGPLGIRPIDLHRLARPVWSLGFRCRWGRRGEFHRAFDLDLLRADPELKRGSAWLVAEGDFVAASVGQALMEARRIPRIDPPQGSGAVDAMAGLQFAPGSFGDMLRKACEVLGVVGAEGGWDLRIVTGEGRGEWVEAPFFCRRAVTGTRARASESLRPYAGLETDAAGWWWRVEHNDRVGLGLAYDPEWLDDAEAKRLVAERLGDRGGELREHDWRCGWLAEPWSGEVLAVGDAAGRFEPMAGMRLPLLLHELRTFCRILTEARQQPGPAACQLHNAVMVRARAEIADFIGLHYLHSGRDEAFWQQAAGRVRLGGMRRLVELYQTAGPSGFILNAIPGFPGTLGGEAWMAAMVGLGVPFDRSAGVMADERGVWHQRLAEHQRIARRGTSPEDALALARQG